MSILATDSFDRADNFVSLGSNWTATVGANALRVIGNAADWNATIHAGNYYNGITWPNDQYAKAIIGVSAASTNEGVGPAARLVNGSGSAYLFQPNSVRSRLFKDVAGSFTQLGSDAASFASSDIVEIDANGTSISALKNGSSIIGPITDSALASGNAGIWAYGTATLASWEGGDFAAVAGGPPDLVNRQAQLLPLLAQ